MQCHPRATHVQHVSLYTGAFGFPIPAFLNPVFQWGGVLTQSSALPPAPQAPGICAGPGCYPSTHTKPWPNQSPPSPGQQQTRPACYPRSLPSKGTKDLGNPQTPSCHNAQCLGESSQVPTCPNRLHPLGHQQVHNSRPHRLATLPARAQNDGGPSMSSYTGTESININYILS